MLCDYQDQLCKKIKYKNFKNLWKMKQKGCVWSRIYHFLNYSQEDLLKKMWPITSINSGIKILKIIRLSKYSSLVVLTHV